MQDLLLDLGWKSALVAGLALLVSHGARRLVASERVMVLRAGVAALLMLPLFVLAMPVLELAVLPAQQTVPVIDPAIPAAPVNGLPDTVSLDPLPWLYGAGAGLAMLHLIVGLIALHRWTRAAVPSREARWIDALAEATTQLRRPVRLLVSRDVPGPLSWGIAPAWVLIGPEIEKRTEQAEAVIAHELAHVRRFDWPVLMAARIATALYWFNPLVWLLARTLARQTELAADDVAVRHVAQADYAQTLLTVASPAVPAAACGMTVSRSMLAGRIRRVLEMRPHRRASRLLGGVLLIGAPAVAAPLAAMQFVPTATYPVAETSPAERQGARSRETVPLVPVPTVAVPNRLTERLPSRATRSAPVEVREAKVPDVATPRQTATPEATEVRERRASRSRRSPEMEEKRATALRLSDSANDMRAEAKRIEADIRTRDVSQREREGTLAGARAMRVEAQRRDDEARRLIFGR